MIEKSESIESVNTWYKSRYATANDVALCAIVTLRLTTADIIEVSHPQRPSPPTSSTHRINPLIRMLRPQLEAWHKYWTCVTEPGMGRTFYSQMTFLSCMQTAKRRAELCHKFPVSFYSHHVQLFLYSFPLQDSPSLHMDGV